MNSPIELKVVVSESYADQLRKAIELDADACCGDSESLAAYPVEVLGKLPGSVVTFGCGNPVALASMQPGETVLDPGGRLMVSDIVLTRPATEAEMQDMALLTGCISGSLPDTEYADTVRRAGFADVTVETAPQNEETTEGQFWYSASISGVKW